MLNNVRVLVYGGRDFSEGRWMSAVLFHYLSPIGYDNIVVIEGEAQGADRMSRWWAEQRGIPVDKYPADWKQFGTKAGPIRNRQMRDEGKPDFGIAFPGGRGTANMTGLLKEKHIPVIEVKR